MILVVGGIKGGGGKTTLATNLAVCRAKAGKKVLLVDADEQRSASDWADHRSSHEDPVYPIVTVSLTGRSIHTHLVALKRDYEDVIVDTGGRDTTSQRSALTVASSYLVPFKPRSLDIWTLGSLAGMVTEIMTINPHLRVIACVNQADPRGKDNEEALNILKETKWLLTPGVMIGARKAFANASSDGLGVLELTHHSEAKAREEILSLCKYIYEGYEKHMETI